MSLYPSLYQVNTRVWLGERSRRLGRPATLDDVTDEFLDTAAADGFDWVWFLGVWQTGPAGRAVSRSHPEWARDYERTLGQLREDDVTGSPYAVQSYTVDTAYGGDEALARLRGRLRERGLRLLVDFVPNHTALDHPWAQDHPERYVRGTEEDLGREPQNYVRLDTVTGPQVFAYGRDPYFSGWPDTLQLNYRHPELRAAQTAELARIATMADGVRCDMAMLLLPEVFLGTWGERSRPGDGTAPVDTPFWAEAIPTIRALQPGFVLAAEVYWDLEWKLVGQGFDYTYDKRLYDRLRSMDAEAVIGHLHAALDYQQHMVRFLENHDEERAASAFPPGVHQAAAIITFLSPGLRFIHEGQLEGRRARVSMHLGRRPDEPVDPALADFYAALLTCLAHEAVRVGTWRLADCRSAWDGNPTSSRFVAMTWQAPDRATLLAVVNYGPTQGQCYLPLTLADLRPDAGDTTGPTGPDGGTVVLQDLMNEARYERNVAELVSPGLYLDIGPWCYHVFEVLPTGS